MSGINYIKVPKNRIAVLIGKDGTVKSYIEEQSNTTLRINSKEGTVQIIIDESNESTISAWKVSEIIKAIGRGFSPEFAYKLFDDETYLEIIDLEEILGKNKSIPRVKARIIGENGKCRKFIEEMTDAHISIYGDTVSIIGEFLPLKIAKSAVMKLIQGMSHVRVYKFLQQNHAKIQEHKFSL